MLPAQPVKKSPAREINIKTSLQANFGPPQRDASHKRQLSLNISLEAHGKQTPMKDSEQIYKKSDNWAKPARGFQLQFFQNI